MMKKKKKAMKNCEKKMRKKKYGRVESIGKRAIEKKKENIQILEFRAKTYQ